MSENTSEPKVVIYGLVDPFTHELRYIGQTIKGILRLRDHLIERYDNHKCHWVEAVMRRGGKPEWFVIEECDERALNEAEIFWIAYFKSIGARLTNGTLGGYCGKLTPESRAKQAASIKGHAVSPETRAKISAAVKASLTPEIRARISAANRARSPEVREKMSASQRSKPPVSAETREKLAAVHRGKPKSAEAVAKMIATRKINRQKTA